MHIQIGEGVHILIWIFLLTLKCLNLLGNRLIDSIGDNKHKVADEVINPVLFLYRHSIELILKAIIVTDYLLENYDYEKMKDKLRGHSLESLWSKTENVIRKYYKKDVEKNIKQLEFARKAVREIDFTDKDSTIFKYPYDRELEKQSVGSGESSYAIDYVYLKNKIEELFDFLSGCFHGLFHIYENQESILVFDINEE